MTTTLIIIILLLLIHIERLSRKNQTLKRNGKNTSEVPE